ncbi:hypothetical protein [Mesorhizobium abyssinicae]|uniref:SLOG domain-containing protein n=1 Tax=Mesorhizobium abyssinicae TaxID=1209958 RepID=UPI00339AEDB9
MQRASTANKFVPDHINGWQRRHNPNPQVLPVPATGAAAAIDYIESDHPPHLANEISFASLFRRSLLPKPLDE